MPWLAQHSLAAALTTVAVLLASGGPAHGVSVTVPLPQTPVPVPEAEVTAPGAQVTIGPGGAGAAIDPQQTLDEITRPPSAGSPPSPGAPTAGAPAGTSGSSPQQGGSAPPGRAERPPRAGSDSGAGRDVGGDGGARAAAGPVASGSASSDTPAEDGPLAVSASRALAADEAARTGVIGQVFEKIRTELLAALVALALFAAAMSLVWLRERGRVRKAQRRAEIDPLTGIANRLAFERRLADEWKRARRYDRPLGLLLVDLDGLKRVNDSGGHEAGDRMIRAAATEISEHIRQSDLLARLAGDEFVVVCPETPAAGLEQLGAKLTERLEQVGIGASVGWAELADQEAPTDLVARADAAMYDEKTRRHEGRPPPRARAGLATAG